MLVKLLPKLLQNAHVQIILIHEFMVKMVLFVYNKQLLKIIFQVNTDYLLYTKHAEVTVSQHSNVTEFKY